MSLLASRWYIVVAGALLTVAATYAVTHQPGVYWAQYNMILLSPDEQDRLNRITDPSYDLAPLASLLVQDWNGSESPLLTGSADTTLFGIGCVTESRFDSPIEAHSSSPSSPPRTSMSRSSPAHRKRWSGGPFGCVNS